MTKDKTENPLEEEIPVVKVPEENSQSSPEEDVASLRDQLLRQIAENENMRKRFEREREETTKYAVTKFARDLLDVCDSLEKAVEAYGASAELSDAGKAFVEGVKLTQSNLLSVFERHKIQKVSPKGAPFDHNFHQALFEVETAEHAPGTVVEVLQPGYVIHDRLLRPAMVGVAKKAASGE